MRLYIPQLAKILETSKKPATGSVSKGEELFFEQCRAVGLIPAREYRFSPPRFWRFDFAFPERKVAVEIEGGVYNGGRHTRGSGFVADCEKYNRAATLGWRVLRFPTHEVKNGHAIAVLEQALGG